MSTVTNEAYRYPGSRPFYDTEVDRRLFFGRDIEKESFLHKVLADQLVVMYAKSGLGKTSLINAGLNLELRKRGFIPLPIRFNNPGIEPVQAVYEGIKRIVKQKSLDYDEGEENSLWQYFKTVHFWSTDDTLLKPVLIFDQFEEFFNLHSFENRKRFTQQLADLVNNDIPKYLRDLVSTGEPFPYTEKPPNVRAIISIREDFLGQLEEMSGEITGILSNRFRLMPLSREQAMQAIVEPSQLQAEEIHAASFKFTPKAVDMMLNFLCKRRERNEIKMTDEVESFQLQLLCRHIEDNVREKMGKGNIDIVVKPGDLGGEAGMQRVLEQFYDDQVKKLDTLWNRKRSRKMCEKGLISVDNRRLSLEQGEIKRMYRLSEKLLGELVNSRLLRSESRVGSLYYELSHDTLVTPIRESQKKRESKRAKIDFGILLMIILTGIVVLFLYAESNKEYRVAMSELESGNRYFRRENFIEAIKNYRKSIESEPTFSAYYNIGLSFSKLKRFDEAIEAYKKSIAIEPKDAIAYNNMGNALYGLKNYKEAIAAYRKANEIEPEDAYVYYNMGSTHYALKDYKEAIAAYKKAIVFDPKDAKVYYNIGIALASMKRYIDAITACKKAIESDPKHAHAYFCMGNSLYGLEKYTDAIAAYKKVIEIDSKYAAAYNNMGKVFSNLKEYKKAVEAYKKAIEIGPKSAVAYANAGDALSQSKRYTDAIAAYKKAIEIDPKNANIYNNMGVAFYYKKDYHKSIEAYRKVIEINPGYNTAKHNLAKAYLNSRQFEKAFKLANEVMNANDIPTYSILAMRLISISSLLFQEKQPIAVSQLKELIKYYQTLHGDYKRKGNYSYEKEFIRNNKTLPPEQTQLLLQLIDILESPKKEGDKKLKEFETSILKIFK